MLEPTRIPQVAATARVRCVRSVSLCKNIFMAAPMTFCARHLNPDQRKSGSRRRNSDYRNSSLSWTAHCAQKHGMFETLISVTGTVRKSSLARRLNLFEQTLKFAQVNQYYLHGDTRLRSITQASRNAGRSFIHGNGLRKILGEVLVANPLRGVSSTPSKRNGRSQTETADQRAKRNVDNRSP